MSDESDDNFLVTDSMKIYTCPICRMGSLQRSNLQAYAERFKEEVYCLYRRRSL